jgi:hypothetical protein
MKSIYPSHHQTQAILARLNFDLGPEEFDRLFLGFEIEVIRGELLYALARSEFCAQSIMKSYTDALLKAAQQVLGIKISFVNIIPRRAPSQPD